MNTRTGYVLYAALAALAVAVTGVALTRAMRAEALAHTETARFVALRRMAEEIAALRSADHLTAQHTKPASLATSTGEVLAFAGLPASVLSSLSPESEAADRTSGKSGIALLRRRATLTLTPLTLPQLGRFLDAWRQRLDSWTVARIDLEPRRDGPPTPGADLPLRVVLGVESVTLAPSPKAPSPPDRRTP